MENVMKQSEILAEAILASKEFIDMRLAEQAVVDNEEAQQLIELYSQQKDAFQAALSNQPLDQDAAAKAGQVVKETEAKITSNDLINTMREKGAAYQDMMQKVNETILRVINGEPEAEECSGSCSSCSGCSGCN